jgi:hypothetical protein
MVRKAKGEWFYLFFAFFGLRMVLPKGPSGTAGQTF